MTESFRVDIIWGRVSLVDESSGARDHLLHFLLLTLTSLTTQNEEEDEHLGTGLFNFQSILITVAKVQNCS